MNLVPYTDLTDDTKSAIAHARVTGSVACTYNGTTAQRLYTHQGGIGGGSNPTNAWMITDRSNRVYITTTEA